MTRYSKKQRREIVDRQVPDLEGPGFRITGGKGFHTRFENGWTVSVQFGHYNYCEHYVGWHDAMMDVPIEAGSEVAEKGSRDAEVAIWDADGGWVTKDEYEQVWPSTRPADLLTMLNAVAAMGGDDTADDLRLLHDADNRVYLPSEFEGSA